MTNGSYLQESDRQRQETAAAGTITDAPPSTNPPVDDFRAIMDALPALVSFFDADHICRFANQHHCRWYGKSPNALIGLHMRDFLGDAAYASRAPELARVAAGEQVSFEARVPHRDGSWRDAAIRYVPKMDHGHFQGLHVLVFDVAVQQHRFQSVFDGTAIGFWQIDLQQPLAMLEALGGSGPSETIAKVKADPGFVARMLAVTPVIALNAKASAMFGVTSEQARGRPLGDWCTAASLPAFTQNLYAFLSGEPSFEVETVMKRSDGTTIDILLSCAFAKNAPGETAVIIGMMDITARLIQEHRLARMQADLAHAARVTTLGGLMASIAHEVNQPLAAVVANGNAAVRWLDRPQPDVAEAKAAVVRSVEEGSRAAQIIQRTRALASKRQSVRNPVDLTLLLEETAQLVARQISALGATLQQTLDPELPKLSADPIQLQQVFINLLVNAAQAMAEHDSDHRIIHVTTSVVEHRVRLDVADTGPGFGTSDPEEVFIAFHTTKETGMGIGLSIARTIIEAHDGTITAFNGADGGAVFRVNLPLEERS